ncbi:MAG: UTP--glucose-1-phosphate uridylyltransferase [Deltaproteobacteria bacterium]|nr:UTP--glucose-1-phosphate uridylyltransferase [Deltaproteobacteria bacterium]
MDSQSILDLLERHGQPHILGHVQRLSPGKREVFCRNLARLNLPLAFQLYGEFSGQKGSRTDLSSIGPAPIISIPKTPEEIQRREKAIHLGEALIRGNQVAVLIVAGGQGTRLGFPGPKGFFPISPVKKKPLFQLFAESIQALSTRYRAGMPLLVMTSQENREETETFFESRGFFGLPKSQVHFFCQGMLPTLTPGGKLILGDETSLLANPDGHGGSLKALYESGLAGRLKGQGVSEIFYFQVDNPLAKIADPAFIGYHRQEGADISTKVVRRQNLEEKVGIYGMVNGKPAIIEYSDFSPKDYRSRDEQGNIRYWAGNMAIHMISLSFVDRLNRRGFALPYHRAVKEVEGLDPAGRNEKMAGLKFETFVFDSIPLAQKACCMEVVREEEFAPVKNQTGIDSPDTARQAMNSLFRRWLTEAGGEVAPNVQVEISPLFALDQEELAEKLKGKKVVVGEDTYFG